MGGLLKGFIHGAAKAGGEIAQANIDEARQMRLAKMQHAMQMEMDDARHTRDMEKQDDSQAFQGAQNEANRGVQLAVVDKQGENSANVASIQGGVSERNNIRSNKTSERNVGVQTAASVQNTASSNETRKEVAEIQTGSAETIADKTNASAERRTKMQTSSAENIADMDNKSAEYRADLSSYTSMYNNNNNLQGRLDQINLEYDRKEGLLGKFGTDKLGGSGSKKTKKEGRVFEKHVETKVLDADLGTTETDTTYYDSSRVRWVDVPEYGRFLPLPIMNEAAKMQASNVPQEQIDKFVNGWAQVLDKNRDMSFGDIRLWMQKQQRPAAPAKPNAPSTGEQ